MKAGGTPLVEFERHFWLTRSVARVMGVSLSEAMSRGHLTPDDYTEMVARCQAGGCHRPCERWLATQTTGSDRPPDFCVITDDFARLASQKRA